MDKKSFLQAGHTPTLLAAFLYFDLAFMVWVILGPLGVIAYQMLSGKLPYGAEVANARSRAAQKKLAYKTVLNEEREIPAWIDDAFRKAVAPDPYARYAELSEFVFDLHHPNTAFLNKTKPPLIERNPVIFWKSVSFVLLLAVIVVSVARFH